MLTLGAPALSDAELVALHLGTGRRGEGVLSVARTLLEQWGGVAGLARADVDELSRTPGVGMAKACRLVAAFALADRGVIAERPVVRTSEDVAVVAIPRIGRARTERVLLIVLDGSHRVSRVLTVATGGATKSMVPVREVLSLALRHDAVAIALAHNHPGGSLDPSAEDVAVTERLRSGAREVGLRFLDHVIVAGDQWRSITASR
ncbi:DNA repair protein RadC [Nostocoides australiense]